MASLVNQSTIEHQHGKEKENVNAQQHHRTVCTHVSKDKLSAWWLKRNLVKFAFNSATFNTIKKESSVVIRFMLRSPEPMLLFNDCVIWRISIRNKIRHRVPKKVTKMKITTKSTRLLIQIDKFGDAVHIRIWSKIQFVSAFFIIGLLEIALNWFDLIWCEWNWFWIVVIFVANSRATKKLSITYLIICVINCCCAIILVDVWLLLVAIRFPQSLFVIAYIGTIFNQLDLSARGKSDANSHTIFIEISISVDCECIKCIKNSHSGWLRIHSFRFFFHRPANILESQWRDHRFAGNSHKFICNFYRLISTFA